jgi:4a-hydroxytetrahydrobiopterin dehydratase
LSLTEDEIRSRLPAGWRYEGAALAATFRFPTYRDGVAFAVKAALYAERHQHHPELTIGYKWVAVRLSTHSAGGVTERDLATAEELSAWAEATPA